MTSNQSQPPPSRRIAIVEDEDDVGTWWFYVFDSAASDLVDTYRDFIFIFFRDEHDNYDEWDE